MTNSAKPKQVAEQAMFVYDSYEPGKVYGHDDFEIGHDIVRRWLEMFPQDDCAGRMPPGMITLAQQNAYKNIITPRPPGHIQGGQTFELYSLPAVGATVRTEVSCESKEIRKERRWVKMKFVARDLDGRLIYTGVNTILVPM